MKSPVVRILVWTLVGFALFVVVVPLILDLWSPLVAVTFGWLAFLQRVIPNVTVSWSGVGMVVVCTVLILAGIHSMAGWLCGHALRCLPASTGISWRWSWTVALYLAVWLLFSAIMGAVGVVHQVGWLARSDEPMFRSRKHGAISRIHLRQRADSLFVAAEEAKWNTEATRRAYYQGASTQSDRPAIVEDFHVILLGDTNDNLRAGIILHREPEVSAKAGFVLVTPTAQSELRPITELPAALARYQSQGVANTNAARK